MPVLTSDPCLVRSDYDLAFSDFSLERDWSEVLGECLCLAAKVLGTVQNFQNFHDIIESDDYCSLLEQQMLRTHGQL